MKITEVKPLDNFRVSLRFNDGVSGVADLSDLAGRGVFQAWKQPGIFEQVAITPLGALKWPGKIDLCPDALYLRVTGKQPSDLFPALAKPLAHA